MTVESLKAAVEALHGAQASVERVAEAHEGETVWEGDVCVFRLEGHPSATRCYAWSEPVTGSDRRRFFAVLHEGPVTSATLALRASIVNDARESAAPPRPDPGDVRD